MTTRPFWPALLLTGEAAETPRSVSLELPGVAPDPADKTPFPVDT